MVGLMQPVVPPFPFPMADRVSVCLFLGSLCWLCLLPSVVSLELAFSRVSLSLSLFPRSPAVGSSTNSILNCKPDALNQPRMELAGLRLARDGPADLREIFSTSPGEEF